MYPAFKNIVTVAAGVFALFFLSCSNSKTEVPVLFKTRTQNQTGLTFNNTLTATDSFNMFHYMYFYNGAGAGAADFNNDGKTDLFFASNQSDNKLFLNQGNLKFTDVTAAAKIPQDKGWSTGVSVVDINNDGLLDIYICKVGEYESLRSKNQLLVCKGINNGVPFYTDEAAAWGIDFSGFSTQAAFFDYDMDGDLDMFLLNHAVHQNGTFAPRQDFTGTYSPLSGDRLYRNNGSNHFEDVTKASTINSSAISYGLGIAVADINLDGWPDLYIGNDFHENDYLYINQHNGTFKDISSASMMHTSQFSMGVDVADVNNDGFPEIISMDMLPSDPYILKRSLGEDDYDIFYHKISVGYSYQYTRNNLQLNKRNGMFSETGLYSGIYATDWSWAPLWMDFDNDGLKDLFISNGIPKRMNDMDYVNFISNEEIQKQLKTTGGNEKDMALVNKFPEIKIPNKFYHNNGNMQFEDINASVAGDIPTFSNGAVYADFDNDGDMDVVVNNINDPVLLYENTSNDKKDKPYVNIKLTGPEKNKNAIGAKIVLYAGSEVRTYENFPVKGFLSSMVQDVHIGLAATKIDSAFLIWPDNSFQPLTINTSQPNMQAAYKKGLPLFNYSWLTNHWKNETRAMEDITSQTGLAYLHQENPFIEFNREFLLPHMVSTEGPALAVADINHDGLEDVFTGAARSYHNAVFIQQPGGYFINMPQPALLLDSMCEDVDAKFADVNNDGNIDLIVASGGNEFYGQEEVLKPRVYLNDGHGQFQKKANAFGDIFNTQSCVAPFDFNNDGFTDLFIGGRVAQWNYGQNPRSWLLQNDGTGKFTDVTEKYAASLANAGMITSAVWVDIDKDGQKDLVLSQEWGPVTAYINQKKSFIKKDLITEKGWWNFLQPVDINNDGNIDFIAGNLGLNSRLKASDKEPVKLYYNDFDDNGKKEQVLTYYLAGNEIPFANKDELQKQLPFIKKKFLYAEDFAKASLKNIFSENKINSSEVLTANYFSNAILINNGHGNFSVQALPWQAQLTQYRTAAITDANNDKLPDILLGGNYYDNNIQMGRYDADFGTLLVNKGNNKFEAENINGLIIKGQLRHILPITINEQPALLIAKNNDSLSVIHYKQPQVK
jgi:hypothetical protein